MNNKFRDSNLGSKTRWDYMLKTLSLLISTKNEGVFNLLR